MHSPTLPPPTTIAALRAARERIYASGQVTGEDGAARPVWPEGVSRERGEALRDLAIRENARRVLETGFAYAMSASFLLEAILTKHPAAAHAREPLVVSMDPFQTIHWRGAGRRHLSEAGVADLHQLHEERSEVVLPRLIAEGNGSGSAGAARFDLAFIDGDHRFEYVFTDVFFARRLLGPGKLIILDDEWMPAARKCAAFYESAGLCRREKTPKSSPLSKFVLLRVDPAGDDRNWEHFAKF